MIKKNILLLCCVLSCLGAGAQSIEQKAGELMQAYTDQGKFSGSVLIAVHDRIVFHRAYGFANLATKAPNTIHTQFRAGSLTKMFTSTLVLQLVQQGKLRLDDRVSRYVPGFAQGDRITIRQLLSHTSGIRGNTPAAASTLADMVNGFQPATPAFAPGEKFEYNNFNYFLLAYIAQKVTGISFPRLLQQRVLAPAGMTHSGMDVDSRQSSSKASGYVTDPATQRWVETGINGRVDLASGAGALYTTTGDLWKWVQSVKRRKLLSPRWYDSAFTAVQPGYGLGWMLGDAYGHAKRGHTGSIPGFIADLVIFPKEEISILFLSNYQDLNGRQLEADLAAIALGQPYTLPKQKKEIRLTADSLKVYAGIYEQSPGVQMNVFVENGQLRVTAPGGDQVELTPEGADAFFLKGPEIEVRFIREQGRIVSMWVNMGGGQLFKRLP